MFDKMKIKEHMEITGKDGQHVGTVDKVDGDRIKLTKSDSDQGEHRFIPLDQLDRVEDNRIYLKASAAAEKAMAATS